MFDTIFKFFYNKVSHTHLAATFRIDRIIDGSAENNMKPVTIGIIKNGQQGIRIGEYGEPINILKGFEKKENELQYKFENDVEMYLTRKTDNAIEYEINSPYHKQKGYLRGEYKTISMESSELDEIEGLQHQKAIIE
jgi:hypothetical protein